MERIFCYCLNLLVLLLLSPVLGTQKVQSFEIVAFTLPGGPIFAVQTVPLGVCKQMPNGFCGRIWVRAVFMLAVLFYGCVWLQEECSPLGTELSSLFESPVTAFYSASGSEQICSFLPH